MLKFLLPSWIFGRELADNRRAWSAWAAKARELGYHGLEIHDRRLLRLPAADADQFIAQSQKMGLEIVLGLDTDFTRPAGENQVQGPAGHLYRLNWAFQRGIPLIRVTTGGQRFSVAELIKRLHPYSPSLVRGVEAFLRQPFLVQWIKKFHESPQRPVSESLINEVIANTAEVLILAERARARLVMENHWGVSTDWRNLAAIMRAVNSSALGVCLDWGNFSSPAEIIPGAQGLLPWIRHVHAKSIAFTPSGEERLLPCRQIVGLLKGAGYDEAFTLEYAGAGDPWEGCRRARDLINRCYRDGPP